MAITDKSKSAIERLKDLQSLYESGILSKEEMEAEKAEILGSDKQGSAVQNAEKDSEKAGTTANSNAEHAVSKSRFNKILIWAGAFVLILIVIFSVLFIRERNATDINAGKFDVTPTYSDSVYDDTSSQSKDTATAQASSGRVTEKLVYYYNVRFDYRIAYPSDFVRQPEPENSDGCEIRRDEKTYILVYGSYNALEETIEDMYNKSLTASTTYSKLGDNWFVISGYTDNGDVFYHKTVLRNDVIFTAIFYYPEDENEHFSKIIPKIFSDFPD